LGVSRSGGIPNDTKRKYGKQQQTGKRFHVLDLLELNDAKEDDWKRTVGQAGRTQVIRPK
jgi:hypothetical protein